MKILITGGTGFVGSLLTLKALEKGHELVLLTRNPNKAKSELQKRLPEGLISKIQFFEWRGGRASLHLPKEVLGSLQGVIHLAGESVAQKRWSESIKKEILSSRIDSTRTLLSEISKSTALEFFISASAIGYYGDREDETLTEDSLAGEGFLADVCVKWEDVLFQSQGSFRKVALRIGLVLDASGGALQKILPLFRSGLGGNLGSGAQWMSWIHREDLVSLILYCIEQKNAQGPINAVSLHPIQNKEFTRCLASVLRRPAFFHAPSFMLKLVLGEMSSVLLGSQRVHPNKAQALGFRFHHEKLEHAFSQILKKA